MSCSRSPQFGLHIFYIDFTHCLKCNLTCLGTTHRKIGGPLTSLSSVMVATTNQGHPSTIWTCIWGFAFNPLWKTKRHTCRRSQFNWKGCYPKSRAWEDNSKICFLVVLEHTSLKDPHELKLLVWKVLLENCHPIFHFFLGHFYEKEIIHL